MYDEGDICKLFMNLKKILCYLLYLTVKYLPPTNTSKNLVSTFIRKIRSAIGGLLITTVGYGGLFWADGVTCVFAGILLLKVLHPRKATVLDKVKVENPISVYSDKIFWIFFIAMFLYGFVFMQYFSTIPLYYKEARSLSEFEIGLLMGLNGFFIFLFEMPLISWLESLKTSKVFLILIGLFLVAISFLVLNITSWVGILIIGILLMTVGEMIAFPFSNSFALERGQKGNQGEYMAMYAISFSLSGIFSHNAGMQMIDKYGYEFTWNAGMPLLVATCSGSPTFQYSNIPKTAKQ